MACRECDRLRSDLKAREREYRLSVECMESVAETAELALWQKLKIKVSEAGLERGLAQLMLEKHQQDGHAV